MQKIKMGLAQKNKFIKLPKHIRITKKSVGIAGITSVIALLTVCTLWQSVASMISILVSSQRNPKSATFNEATSNRIGTTQGSSETTAMLPNWDLTNPSIMPPLENTTIPNLPAPIPETVIRSREALTNPSIMPSLENTTITNLPAPIPGTATTSREALTTSSIMPPHPLENTTVPYVSAPIPGTALMSRGALTTPSIMTPPPIENATVQNLPATFPETATTSRAASTTPSIMPPIENATVQNLPATFPETATTSREVTTPNTTTTPDNFKTPSRLSTTLNSTLSSNSFATTPNITDQPSEIITPSSTTTTSTLPFKARPATRTSIAASLALAQETKYLEQAIDDANATALGLLVANRENQIKPYSETWKKTQDAISLLRQGNTRQESARRAGIPISVLAQLIEWGQDRPSGVRPVEPTSTTAKSFSAGDASYLEQAIDDANAAVFGLLVANREGQIKPQSETWKKTQDAISLLRQGNTRQESARRAGIPMSVLTQLIEWGKNRP